MDDHALQARTERNLASESSGLWLLLVKFILPASSQTDVAKHILPLLLLVIIQKNWNVACTLS